MSFVSQHELLPEASVRISVADPSDYLALLKPRVMSLVVFTALAGLLVAPGTMHPLIAFVSLLAIAVGAGASGALNMWYDADIDLLMSRTQTRPVPSGRIQPKEALGFGLTLAVFSVLTLALVANFLAAGLLAFTIFFYAVVYTMLLKRSTPQNIVIGGAAGALPPVVAYAAATNSVSLSSLVLFAIIFIWTPPHFWALALVKSADYARAGIPMMPNVKGPDRTRLEIVLYTILLVPLGVAPYFLGFASPIYGVVAAVSGLGMLAFAILVYRRRVGPGADRTAMQMFAYSILYLFLLFAVIVVENGFDSAIRHFG
jgi:protoheme IX farnesyltransferase